MTSSRPVALRLSSTTLPIAAVIPAYEPDHTLLNTVIALAPRFSAIIVVDDGSGPAYRVIFDQLLKTENLRILRHAVNLGKGAALKTGMNYALVEFPEIIGVVTADADGQHDPQDILNIGLSFATIPSSLVIGARAFAGAIPFRSRFGNALTRRALRLLVGQALSDTQSGLRAVPRSLIERLLRVPASGYEFELEMLIAARHLALEVVEQPIRAIYTPGNPTSHFHPVRDSMRIYFVLLRFTLISLATAALDNIAFYLFFRAMGVIPLALIGARILALMFNYTLVRAAVFHSNEPNSVVLPRYLVWVAVYICMSYTLIRLLSGILTLDVLPAKMLAESLLFIVNFAMQRDFVFQRRIAEKGAL